MRRVLVGTPTYTADVKAQFFFAYTETQRLCWEHGIDLRPLLPYNHVITHARNYILAAAVKHGFDDLVFADADQDWNPADFLQLLSYPVDCVGAPVRKKAEGQELYNVRSKLVAERGLSGFSTDPATGLMTAPDMALGTGFLRLSKAAMHTLWDKAEPYTMWGEAEEYRWVFEMKPQNGQLVSEDNIMCDKLRAAGILIWLDPSIVVGHYGDKKYEGDFLGWLRHAHDAEVHAAAVVKRAANGQRLPQAMRAAE